MPEFLCLLTPSRDTFPGDATAAELAVVGEHFAYLQSLLGRGVLVLAGRTQEEAGPIGLVILRAADMAEAERLMAEDPAVRARVFGVEIRAYRVALMEGQG